MKPQFFLGESLRWYLKRARHPFKAYLVGHYWDWFCKPRVWIRYDDQLGINVCLADYVQHAIFFEGYYERPLIEWLKKNLRADDIFWDVGANVGAVSLVAARHCRRVVAFEPDERSVRLLRENVRFNALPNLQIIPMALGAHTGSVLLYRAAATNTGMSSIMEGHVAARKRVTVAIQRADDFLAARSALVPNIIKMDVEGAEHLVVQGAEQLLRDARLRALLFEDRADAHGQPSNDALVAPLRDAGFAIQLLGASDEHARDGMANFLAQRTTYL